MLHAEDFSPGWERDRLIGEDARLIAGALGVLFRPDQLAMWIGGGFVSILVMMLAGVPVYVCATASVPIAAALIHAGASPGAALAFLIAGPATNAAALTTVSVEIRPRLVTTALMRSA